MIHSDATYILLANSCFITNQMYIEHYYFFTEELIYGVHARFWMQPNIVTFMWVGIGISYLLYLIPSKSLRLLCTILLPIMIPVAQIYTNYELMDQSEN